MTVAALVVVAILTVVTVYVVAEWGGSVMSRHRKVRFSGAVAMRWVAVWEIAVGVELITTGSGSLAVANIGLGLAMLGGQVLQRKFDRALGA